MNCLWISWGKYVQKSQNELVKINEMNGNHSKCDK